MSIDPVVGAPLPGETEAVLNAAQLSAQQLIEGGAPLRDILAVLTTAIETMSEDRTVASILVLDDQGLLRNGASPNLPADYLAAIDRLKPEPELGTCAAAAATGEIVMTPNFYDDGRWAELRHWPMVLGFFGGWSMPIKQTDGRVLGTFGTYFREHRLPTADERGAVARLISVAATAIIARGPVVSEAA